MGGLFTRLILLFFCGCQLARAASLSEWVPTPESAPNRILIRPKAGVSLLEIDNLHAARNFRVLRTFSHLGGIQVVHVPEGETVQSAMARYRNSGRVDFAEPDYPVYAAATTPNDPRFLDGTLWGLNNFGQENGTPGADLHAIDAWDIRTSASNVVVAILDTGVRDTHEDLAANMWVNPIDGGHGYNAFTGTNDVNDDQGHGTMIAGIVGAEGNNGKGITGVAWQVQIMACKCLDNEGEGFNSTVIASMEYALTNGAQIINASFSSSEFSEAVSNAIVSLRDAGIIVVAPAGNNLWANVDLAPRYPACYDIDNIVSVASVTRDDQLGYISNYGATNVDLAAPGDQIYSTYHEADDSYHPTNYPYDSLSGTSFAAAYVSGALALMRAKYPMEDYQQTLFRLLHTTTPVAELAGNCVTGGRLNLRKALCPPIELLPLSTHSEPFQLRISGGPFQTYAVESSPDLATWLPIYTNTTSANWNFDFTDDESTNSCQKFYRAVLLP